MQVEAGVRQQPLLDGRRLVGDVVVQDQVHVETGGDFFVELGQELRELDSPMAPVQGADHLAGGDFQGGEQGGGAGADVVMAAGCGAPSVLIAVQATSRL